MYTYVLAVFVLLLFHRIYMYVCFLLFATTSLVNKDLYLLRTSASRSKGL